MKLTQISSRLLQTGLASTISLVGVAGSSSGAIAPLTGERPSQAITKAPAVLAPQSSPALQTEVIASSITDVLADVPSEPSLAAPSSNPPPSNSTGNSVQILSPTVDSILDVSAATVIVQYPNGSTVELRVNGELIDDALVGRTALEPATGSVTRTWYGVPLTIGRNTLTVTSIDSGEILAIADIQVRGKPADLTITTRGGTVPADDRSTITVQGQLLDENGNVSNWDTVVTLTASAGTFTGADYAPDTPGFQVETDNGRYSAELQSSLEAQVVQLEAKASGLTAYNQVQFVTPQRPTLITGMLDLRWGAEGANFYGSREDFLDPDAEGYELDFTGTVFAIGNLGEWLFTGAYNSDRPLNEDCAGESTLFRQQSQACDEAYPIYGDNSSREVLTPSIDSLYLSFERTSPVRNAGTDYFLWGDYTTEEFSGEARLYTGVSRSLHGFKGHFNFGDLTLTGFYGNNVEGFQRDTLSPDGTSGTYFLSNRLLVAGSEAVYLELEELDRPGMVIEREQLHRGADYEIDYERGTLQFRDPVLRTSIGEFGRVLVRRIVVTYQFEGEGTDTNIIGGRLQYHFSRDQGQESWLGATYLREKQGSRAFELYGADVRLALGESAEILAEYAHSNNDFDADGPVYGSAYRVEFNGDITQWLRGRAYYRHTNSGFSNLSTESFRPGQTRYGAQVNARLSTDTTLRVQYDRERNRGVAPRPLLTLEDLIEPGSTPLLGNSVDNSLTTISVGLSQRLGDSHLDVDWIHRDREDNAASDRLSATSDQIRTRLSTDWGDGLTTYLQNEINVSSDRDPLYPNRTLFGLDWEVLPGISLGVGQVFLGDNLNDRNSFTLIDLSGDYKLGEDTTVYGQLALIEGQQMGGRLGFEQGFTLAPGLRLDLSYERLFNNFSGSTAAGEVFSQPFAVGDGASALQLTSGNSFSVGLVYTDSADFQASTRLEHSTSSQGANTVFTASALGRLSPAISTLFDFHISRTANQVIDVGTSTTLKLGLAYRHPQRDNLNALLRYEYRKNPSAIPGSLLFGSSIDTSEHLVSAEAVYAPNWRWELFGKYAFRLNTTRIGGLEGTEIDFPEFQANSLVQLAQLRATYRLGYSWDVTGEARWIGTSAGYSEFGAALELGYYMTPDLRLYAGYSLGGASDRDFSGSNRSVGGPYVGITAKLNNLFGGFGIQEIAPPQQQESAVEAPVSEAEDGPPTAGEPVAPGEDVSTEGDEATDGDAASPHEASAAEASPPSGETAPVAKPNTAILTETVINTETTMDGITADPQPADVPAVGPRIDELAPAATEPSSSTL